MNPEREMDWMEPPPPKPKERTAILLSFLLVVLWWGPLLGYEPVVEITGDVSGRNWSDLAWKIFDTTWGDPIVRYVGLGILGLGWLLRSNKKRKTP